MPNPKPGFTPKVPIFSVAVCSQPIKAPLLIMESSGLTISTSVSKYKPPYLYSI